VSDYVTKMAVLLFIIIGCMYVGFKIGAGQ
jgi:hypothetical protein